MNRRQNASRAPRPAPRAPAQDLLFEIVTEELPAAYLPSLIEQLGATARTLFQTHHLPYHDVESMGTPRRLVLMVRGLASVQRTPGEEVRGPSKQAAYGSDGKPTQALHGFLRSQGGTLQQVKLVRSEKGEYVYLMKPPRTTPTAKILPTLLPRLIESLRAPKTMRWDASGVRFARPIRWLLARYGAQPIRCVFGTLTSRSRTWVGGPVRPRAVVTTSIEGYLRALKRAGIILDAAERRAWIERTVVKLAAQSKAKPAPEMIPRLAGVPPNGGTVAHDLSSRGKDGLECYATPPLAGPARRGMISHGLLDEVTDLVERPVPLVGGFDRKYLDLPREVLLASMAKYQRVFAMESTTPRAGQAGTIVPRFVAILEGAPRRPKAVGEVIERILNARLADSLMFWQEDRRRPIDEMATALSGVTFQERLGSMADKADRLHTLSAVLEQAWGLSSSETKELRRACQLAKADLVSTMVKEFPTLQGVMGKHYAQHAGEPSSVCHAIEEHYLPIGETLPQTVIGSALAILDKYDTLSSYFAQGIMPTGDQDPFGLRRAAQGIVEVAWKAHRPLPLDRLLQARAAIHPFLPKAMSDPATAVRETGTRITRYLLERLYTFAWPKPTPSADYIDAVLSSPCEDLVDVMDRIVGLRRLGNQSLLKAAKVIERTRNILKGASRRPGDVDTTLLKEAPEQRLWDLYNTHRERVTRLAGEKSYDQATVVFGDVFFDPLHEFFDRVLVNVPEESLQQNRLALMQAINTLYTERIADLSKLTILQQQREESHA